MEKLKESENNSRLRIKFNQLSNNGNLIFEQTKQIPKPMMISLTMLILELSFEIQLVIYAYYICWIYIFIYNEKLLRVLNIIINSWIINNSWFIQN